MSKINQIQNKIHELSGDVFQKVADAYLHAKGYNDINPLGSVIGADKVRKGTPDSLCTLPNGKYVFFEYTTQKSNLYKKIIDDLEKCFNRAKTGIAVDLIEEVVYCHTSSLTPEEEKGIRNQCQDKGVNINIFGIGPLSFDLYQKYPGIARDLLGIEVDTGQVISIDDFVTAYNKSAVATPLDTQFQFRDEEVTSIVSMLETTDLVIISGRSGVGKSRIALECCHRFKLIHSEYEVRCVFNRGVSIFEDLAVHFSDFKPFLILVDDANRLNQLDYVLQWIHKQEMGRKIKIIATVRDYAKVKIQNLAREYGGYYELEVNPLNNEQISDFIKEEYEIKNIHYLDRISEISKGNPRLAIMAAKVAKRENNLQSIADVTNIYEEYYESIKRDINALDDENVKKAAGIVSLLRTVDFLNIDQMVIIEEVFSISKYEFWEAVKKLHDIEVFDMYENEAVKVADQVLATYLLYLTVFKENIIDFSDILKNFFPNRKQLIIDAINPVLNSLYSQKIMEKLSSHVKYSLAIAKENGDWELVMEFYNAFWFIDQTSTLLFVKDSLKVLEVEILDYRDIQIKKNDRISNPSLLSILSAFISSDIEMFNMANELLVSLYNKRPSLASNVYTILTESFGFDVDSYLLEYEHQNIVIDVLWKEIQLSKDELLMRLFIKVAGYYVRTKFESSESQGNSVLFRRFELYKTDSLTQLRGKIWNFIFELFHKENLRSEILELIYNYSSSRLEVCTTEIIQSDSLELFTFLFNSLNKESYLECSIMQTYLDLLNDHKIEFDEQMQQNFKNETYILSEVLFGKEEEYYSEVLDYNEKIKMRNIRISEYFREFVQDDYSRFFSQCTEIKNSGFLGNRDEYSFNEGFLEVFQVLIDRDPKLGLEVLNDYLNLNDPLSFSPTVLMKIFKLRFESYTLLLGVIQKSCVVEKDKWLFGYLYNIPENLPTQKDVELLLDLYRSAKPEYVPYHTDYLLKYTATNEEIIKQVVVIALERINNNKYFAYAIEMIFNPHTEINKELEILFRADIELLEQAYLAVMKNSNFVDYDGSALRKILNLDPKFILEFVRNFDEMERLRNHESIDFSCVWDNDKYNEIMEGLLIFLYEYEQKNHSHNKRSLLKFIFLGNKKKKTLAEERQDSFLKIIIRKYNSNIELMRMVFYVVSNFSTSRKLMQLQELLSYNKEYSLFRKLPLEKSSRGWSGSEIPILLERITFFESVLGLLNSVDLLEHSHEIEGCIRDLRYKIEKEKKREFLTD
ncbi:MULTISPECIES: hypothetical protein [unclassified Paenibacillus]|uniref:hypothetical protein n=1 Tax=unclassified Paenibacillus TaxID=185978 RepID=UPI00122E7171|nr:MULTISPECIES: hypothetical protein [unclassified Paenibacillus]QZN75736.1 hypothetical protein K5K90_31120 [Paenibacillus sp. DR312]